MDNIKQIIVIRKDLNMRKGKIAAQAAHASLGRFTQYAEFTIDPFTKKRSMIIPITEEDSIWLENSFTKICVYVNSEDELLDLDKKVKERNIPCYLIQDNGVTEFNGIKTYTSLSIGPWWSNELNELTGNLPLL